MSQEKKINIIENVLVRLIKCENYFQLCTGHAGQFWPVIQNSIGESVCVFWYHIFGNRNDDLHFTQFFNDEIESKFTPEEVKSLMLSSLGMTQQEYTVFWTQVKECRDKFVSHKELDASVVFPHIDKCRVQAEALRKILSDYVK